MFARLKALPFPILLTVLTVLRLIAAARAPLVPDETYYRLWAQHPAMGYYDHPPMVAWWIDATSIFGSSALSVRLLFVLSFAAVSWLVFDTAKTLFGFIVARRSLLWLNACLMLSIGTVLATPDPPSVLMWAGGLWALARLQASEKSSGGRGGWWLVFGLFAGMGVEAKYTNFFLGLGVVLWVLLDRETRKHLLTPWPYLGAVVAAAAMAPNLLWNADHHWLTLAKQFGRITPGHLTAKYLIEFVVSQPLLLNPLIFAFVVIAVIAWWKGRSNTRLTLLIALPAPAIAYMLIHVFHDRIQGNWTAPLFPGLVVLAAAGTEGITGKWLSRCLDWAAPLGVGLSALALVFLGLGGAAPAIGAAGTGQGWDRLSRDIQTRAIAAGASWVATTDYDTEGELNYYLRGIDVTAMEERDRYNWPTRDAAHVGQVALIVVPADRHPDLGHCFTGISDLGILSRGVKHNARSEFHLYAGRLRTVGCEVEEAAEPRA